MNVKLSEHMTEERQRDIDMAVWHFFTINGHQIYRSNEFTPSREMILAEEYTSMSGKVIGDLVGWRYADMTLQWDTLPQAMLLHLLDAQTQGAVSFVFDDVEGSHTEQVIISVNTSKATRFTNIDGHALWSEVECEVRFINAHSV